MRSETARRVWIVDAVGVAVASVTRSVVTVTHKLTVGLADGWAQLVCDAAYVRAGRARAEYLAFWIGADARAIDAAAARGARSVRAGKVSDTSRDEARAAARASLIESAERLTRWGWTWHQATNIVTRDDDAMKSAVAAARASLRGEHHGGMVARDSVVKGRAVASNDGAGGVVWSMDRGEWITVRRADGATALDQAGRIITEERGLPPNQANASRDAAHLVAWLLKLRLARLAGQRGGKLAGAARAKVIRGAARVCRVLCDVASGESLALAWRGVGWAVVDSTPVIRDGVAIGGGFDCPAWRGAVAALTEAALGAAMSLPDAAKLWRASQAA